MRLLDRLATPQSEGALQTMRQILGDVQNLNNPVVAATAAMIVGIGIGFAVSSLLASKDDDDLKQRIEKLSG
jgi:hypothetical protein